MSEYGAIWTKTVRIYCFDQDKWECDGGTWFSSVDRVKHSDLMEIHRRLGLFIGVRVITNSITYYLLLHMFCLLYYF